jgi:hypothetical protein
MAAYAAIFAERESRIRTCDLRVMRRLDLGQLRPEPLVSAVRRWLRSRHVRPGSQRSGKSCGSLSRWSRLYPPCAKTLRRRAGRQTSALVTRVGTTVASGVVDLVGRCVLGAGSNFVSTTWSAMKPSRSSYGFSGRGATGSQSDVESFPPEGDQALRRGPANAICGWTPCPVPSTFCVGTASTAKCRVSLRRQSVTAGESDATLPTSNCSAVS